MPEREAGLDGRLDARRAAPRGGECRVACRLECGLSKENRVLGRGARADRIGERGVAVDQPRQRDGVEPPAVVQQAVALFADVAHASRDAREEWNQRRLPGVRQHIGGLIAVAGKLAREMHPPREFEPAAREADAVHAADAGHVPENRRRRGSGEDVDAGVGLARQQAGDQGLAHDGIANPAGRNDQDIVQCEGLGRSPTKRKCAPQ